jgi:hypothetical protein
MVKLWGRNPAYWAGAAALVLQMLVAFGLPLSTTQQGLVNAFLVALAAVVTALAVKADNMVPIFVGAVQALVALAVGFGLPFTDVQATMVVAVVNMILTGILVRPNVVAPVDITSATVVGPVKSLQEPRG